MDELDVVKNYISGTLKKSIDSLNTVIQDLKHLKEDQLNAFKSIEKYSGAVSALESNIKLLNERSESIATVWGILKECSLKDLEK